MSTLPPHDHGAYGPGSFSGPHGGEASHPVHPQTEHAPPSASAGSPYPPPPDYPYGPPWYPLPSDPSQPPYPGMYPGSGMYAPPNAYPYAPYGYGMGPAGYAYAPAYAPHQGDGAAITALVLGIVGFCLAFIVMLPICGLLAYLVPVVGLVFGIIGLRSVTKRGLAIAGIVLSGIDLTIAVVITLAVALVFSAMSPFSYSSGSSAIPTGQDVTGTWTITLTPDAQPTASKTCTLDLNEIGSGLTGTLTCPDPQGGEVDLTGAVYGTTISFSGSGQDTASPVVQMTFDGTVNSIFTSMGGTLTAVDQSSSSTADEPATGTWHAERVS